MLPIVIPLRAKEDRDWKVQPTPLQPLTSGVSVVGYTLPELFQCKYRHQERSLPELPELKENNIHSSLDFRTTDFRTTDFRTTDSEITDSKTTDSQTIWFTKIEKTSSASYQKCFSNVLKHIKKCLKIKHLEYYQDMSQTLHKKYQYMSFYSISSLKIISKKDSRMSYDR